MQKVQSCVVSQGAQDCSPSLHEFGTFIGAEVPWEEAQGCAWAVSTPQSRSFLQLNALPESREAGTQQGGSMFYMGFGVKPGEEMLLLRLLVFDTTWTSRGHQSNQVSLCGQNKMNFTKTHIGISKFERSLLSLKIFHISCRNPLGFALL